MNKLGADQKQSSVNTAKKSEDQGGSKKDTQEEQVKKQATKKATSKPEVSKAMTTRQKTIIEEKATDSKKKTSDNNVSKGSQRSRTQRRRKGSDTEDLEVSEEGFGSDDMGTEPLDRTREVLEELEQKVLEKYTYEIGEAQYALEQTYKLQAGENADLGRVFQDSLG